MAAQVQAARNAISAAREVYDKAYDAYEEGVMTHCLQRLSRMRYMVKVLANFEALGSIETQDGFLQDRAEWDAYLNEQISWCDAEDNLDPIEERIHNVYAPMWDFLSADYEACIAKHQIEDKSFNIALSA